MSAINPLTRDVSATDAWKATGSGAKKPKTPAKTATSEVVPFGQPAGQNVPGVKLYYYDGKSWKPVPGKGLKSGQVYQLRVMNGTDVVAGFRSAWGPGLSRQFSKTTLGADLKVLLTTFKAPDGSMSVRLLSSLDSSKYKSIDLAFGQDYAKKSRGANRFVQTSVNIYEDKASGTNQDGTTKYGKTLYSTGRFPFQDGTVNIGPGQVAVYYVDYLDKNDVGFKLKIEVRVNKNGNQTVKETYYKSYSDG